MVVVVVFVVVVVVVIVVVVVAAVVVVKSQRRPPERLRDVFATKRYTNINPCLPLPYLSPEPPNLKRASRE